MHHEGSTCSLVCLYQITYLQSVDFAIGKFTSLKLTKAQLSKAVKNTSGHQLESSAFAISNRIADRNINGNISF